MLQWIVRSVLRKILTAPETKHLLMVQLRDLAAKSETTIDDTAVNIVSEVWDVAIPVIVGQIK